MAKVISKRTGLGLAIAVALFSFGLVDALGLGVLQGLPAGAALAVGAGLASLAWWLLRRAAGQQQQLLMRLQQLLEKDGPAPTADEVGPAAAAVLSQAGASLQVRRQAAQAQRQLATEMAAQIRGVAQRCKKALDSTANGTQEAESAVGELAEAVQEVARSAAEAANSTHQAAKEADSGKITMTEAMGAMSNLGEQIGRAGEAVSRLGKESQNIGAVLDVIRGIAEQTNLLALNAAIEAARAGEQGRGFAVVADEVRTLASRTQRSTQEIQQMIERLQSEAEGAVGEMGQGTSQATVVEELIENACISLAEIGGAVSSIDSMNTQIASAAEQQHAAVQSIHGMFATRGTRGAALEKALAEMASIADSLEKAAGEQH